MPGTSKILSVSAREILDSRGFPTVEVELSFRSPSGEAGRARASVPSGASTGEGEAVELRDGDKKRFLGKGVLKAVKHVREKIAPVLTAREFSRQPLLDDFLCQLDATPNKAALGANAILAVSMAHCRAWSQMQGTPLYRYIAELSDTGGTMLPVPLMNILNGGKHADNGLAIQEFMIVPAGFETFSEALRAGTEVFHYLKKILHAKGLHTAVGDEGGFAPVFDGSHPHEQALSTILQAISDAGYKPGKEIFLALDCAASEFASSFKGPLQYQFEGQALSSQDLVKQYKKWVDSYPILSIEDGLSEHDWTGWKEMTRSLGGRCQLVGDDLFVTNPKYVQKGIDEKAGNAVLIKLNQIGTVTETLETMRLSQLARYATIVSHRSGETEDTFIADLAVGTSCGQIKTGSASRTDRVAKYNQLLRIEEELGTRASFAGIEPFKGLKEG